MNKLIIILTRNLFCILHLFFLPNFGYTDGMDGFKVFPTDANELNACRVEFVIHNNEYLPTASPYGVIRWEVFKELLLAGNCKEILVSVDGEELNDEMLNKINDNLRNNGFESIIKNNIIILFPDKT